ncbi:MAG: ribonuclease [Actinomycetota bacterium]|nr:ribonuclease [Actinomycetota bacterium]
MVEHAVDWVDSQGGLEDLSTELAGADAVAVDTEFHREKTYFPRVALVQVAWTDGLALIDPLELDLGPLAKVITGDAVTVAHAAEQDLEVLDRSCGAVPRELFDTQVAAGFLGFSTPSLSTLVAEMLGIKLPKADRLTDWTRRPLTANQRTYAAADVAHLLELQSVISERLRAMGRLEWARQECALVLSRRSAPDPTIAWWRMKDARSLRGRARGVAQAVAEWRDREAMRRDLPARFVLPDMAMASLVHRAPGSREELGEIRGLDAKSLRAPMVEGLLAAVARGSELDAADVRVPPTDDLTRELRPAVALVASWIAQLARTVRIDATLLATRSDIAAFLRGDQDARLANGWRNHLIGGPIRRLVEGEAALAFAGDGQLVLEERSYRTVPVDIPTTGEG